MWYEALCGILCCVVFACSLASVDSTCLHVGSLLCFPSLHSPTVGSWCILKHMSSQITVRADRPLAYNLNAQLMFGLWHHGETCLVSALKLSCPRVYCRWFPLHRRQLCSLPFWRKLLFSCTSPGTTSWPHECPTRAIKSENFIHPLRNGDVESALSLNKQRSTWSTTFLNNSLVSHLIAHVRLFCANITISISSFIATAHLHVHLFHTFCVSFDHPN